MAEPEALLLRRLQGAYKKVWQGVCWVYLGYDFYGKSPRFSKLKVAKTASSIERRRPPARRGLIRRMLCCLDGIQMVNAAMR